MMSKWRTLLAVVVALVFVGGSVAHLEGQSVPRMSVDELNDRLGESSLVVLDVRSEFDWSRSQAKIAGAVREAPGRIDWAEKYSRNDILVLYCT
jgi:hypothetical protein